jgi:hypothetical protein
VDGVPVAGSSLGVGGKDGVAFVACFGGGHGGDSFG